MGEDSSDELPLLTFNSLYNILREEKKTKALQKLPEQFYEACKKFLDDKNQEVKKAKSSGDTESVRKETYIIKNSKKILKELLSLRCNKISKLAIENQIFGEGTLDVNNVLEIEEKFLNSVKDNVKRLDFFKV